MILKRILILFCGIFCLSGCQPSIHINNKNDLDQNKFFNVFPDKELSCSKVPSEYQEITRTIKFNTPSETNDKWYQILPKLLNNLPVEKIYKAIF